MMKKTIIMLLTFLLMMTSVFAQDFGLQTSVEVREKVMEQINDEQAIRSLNQSITRARERLMELNRTYKSYDVQEMTSKNITLDARRQGRLFGLIPFSVTEEVVIDNEGEILQTRESFWHRFMRFES